VAQAYSFYNRVLDASAGSLRNIARAAPDPKVGYEQVTALGLFQAADAMSRGDALGVAVAGAPALTTAQYQEYINQIAFYHQQLQLLLPQLTPQERVNLSSLTRSQEWRSLTSV